MNDIIGHRCQRTDPVVELRDYLIPANVKSRRWTFVDGQLHVTVVMRVEAVYPIKVDCTVTNPANVDPLL